MPANSTCLTWLGALLAHVSYVSVCLRAFTSYPVDRGRKLNVHKTFRRRPGRLLNVLCTFNLRPVSIVYVTSFFMCVTCLHFLRAFVFFLHIFIFIRGSLAFLFSRLVCLYFLRVLIFYVLTFYLRALAFVICFHIFHMPWIFHVTSVFKCFTRFYF